MNKKIPVISGTHFGWWFWMGLFALFLSLPWACAGNLTTEPPVENSFNETSHESSLEHGADVSEGVVQESADSSDAVSDSSSNESAPDPSIPENLSDRVTADHAVVDASSELPEFALDHLLPELFSDFPPEAAFPTPGFGQISGDCNVLDEQEWNSSQPFLFRNSIDLGTANFDAAKLTQGGQKIWKDGNLGGSSVHSEVFAYEVLYRCELATLLKSEAEVQYKDSGGKKTDLLVSIDNRKVGVSVTRAFHFPPTQPYTLSEATTLLTKKLQDIPLSAANASTQDVWSRSILYVLAYNKQHADTVETAFHQLGSSVRSNIIVFVMITDGYDDYIY